MKKYLVTGGAGFIGSNIVKKLLEKGEFVRVADNLSTGKKENIEEFFDNPNFEFIEGDLTDLDIARKSVKGIDFVLHEAAVPSVARSIEDPIKSNDSNITSTLNLLVAAKDEGVKKFVYASSSSIYGDNPELPKREDFPIKPISPYALTKYAGERYCQIFWQIYKFPTISLRYFNVFGPRQDPKSQYAAVMPNFIFAFLKNERPIIYGTGEQSRDFTFVENVVQANILAANSGEGNGEVLNIACGDQTSLNQLVDLLKEITGKDIKADYQKERQGDVLHSKADISKAENIINYHPIVNFKDGLAKTFEWYKQNEKL
ncbi:MAG: SDR family oxidoreductase [Candidatus Staskawiczbacteria bacterium]|nr:SDR family oxidoreductase [Candidatus Staskawiczbacteria bacterium]